MSLSNPFRSLPIAPLKPDILARWMSALKSPRPFAFLNPRSPEFIPAMATAVLIGAAGVQIALPSATVLPQPSELAPRHPREPFVPPVPDYPAILDTPIFAPDRKPDASAVPVAGGMEGFDVLGIATAGDTATAVVREPGGSIQRLKPGEQVQGWTLVAVELRQLTFERNKERRVLMLTKTPPPVVAAPAESTSATTSDSGDSSDNNDNNQ
jgi:hypothetical protein